MLSLLMALADEAHRAEEQLRRLKTTFNKAESQRFPLGTRRPTVFKRVGQDFEHFKHSVKVTLLSDTSKQ